MSLLSLSFEIFTLAGGEGGVGPGDRGGVRRGASNKRERMEPWGMGEDGCFDVDADVQVDGVRLGLGFCCAPNRLVLILPMRPL